MSESEVRQLRAKAFMHECSDAEWEKVKHNWMKPDNIQWLLRHQEWPFK